MSKYKNLKKALIEISKWTGDSYNTDAVYLQRIAKKALENEDIEVNTKEVFRSLSGSQYSP